MQGMEWDRGGDTSVIINNLKLNKVENTLNFNLMNRLWLNLDISPF